MKKIFLAILLAFVAIGSWAGPVSQSRAEQAASLWVKTRTGQNLTVKQVLTAKDQYYIINFAPKGWVIIAADDAAAPIVGYSFDGQLTWSSLPENMRAMLSEMGGAIKHEALTRSTSAKWKNLKAEFSRADEGSIEPLIKVNWNQTSPFNKYCPKPTSGSGQAIVGCVAVAMSQAMSVQRWPNKGKGSHRYTPAGFPTQEVNWDSEKNYDWDAIISGTNRNDEAARLLYHAGVSVSMGYGVNGSGIPSNEVSRISNALKNFFCYPADVNYIWRDNYHGDWDRMIYNELAAGRAVIYNAISMTNTGSPDAGHSFNVDGFDGAGRYHLNWGWGGTGNGYFALDRLNVSGYQYNYDQVAVIGIGSPNRELRSIELTETTIDENLPAGTVVGEILVNGVAPKSDYTVTVRGAYDASIKGFPTVDFAVKNGQLVTTAPLKATSSPINVEISVSAKSGDRLSSEFSIKVVAWRKIETATTFALDRASGNITITTKHGVSYVLARPDGSQISSGLLEPLPKLEFNKSQLGDGVNTLTLTNDEGDKKVLKIKK